MDINKNVMKNLLKHMAAALAIFSLSSCDYPGQSPEAVATDYVQALCDEDTDAMYETLALPEDLSAVQIKAIKDYIQHYMEFSHLTMTYPHAIKDCKVVKETDIDATVVVYYEDKDHKEDSIKVYLTNDRKMLKTWRVLEPTTFPFQLLSGDSDESDS